MKVRLVLADGASEEIKTAHLAHVREHVREWVAGSGHLSFDEWPMLLNLLGDVAELTDTKEPMSPDIRGVIESLTEESVAVAATMAARLALHFGVSAELMVQMHLAEGDAIPGTTISGFMLNRPLTKSETHVLAHLLGTLSEQQCASVVTMAAAFLVASGFTPDDIRKMEHPSTEDTQ